MSRLDKEQRRVEQELITIVQNREEADRAYDKIKGSMQGKLLCVNLARNLSPSYPSNKAKFTPATINAATVYIVDRLDRELRKTKKKGPLLLILAGGELAYSSLNTPSTSLKEKVEQADLIFGSTMTRFEADYKLIDQALLFGWRVHVYFIYHPYHELVLDMLQSTQLTGSYVGLGKGKDMSRIHVESRLCFEQVYYNFRERKGIEFYVLCPNVTRVEDFLSQPRPNVQSLLLVEEKVKREFVRSGGLEQVIQLCEKGTRMQSNIDKREHNHLYWNRCNL
ncbi:P-loop containing nucleoside triphosphate hydrolase [Brazilian cedratvirus IHUMI]|uniref:P-loop containing nucleoside triphosphate hydrolase n=1 Tax=Brazilian cedratvirus IHUMI TaxID=2126980 RepID=A0A2R8FDL0_9VIRU|nr:P-loop containing nucleoside triphosphate hydrolase [Brazilian cedratvirus IHUMI]